MKCGEKGKKGSNSGVVKNKEKTKDAKDKNNNEERKNTQKKKHGKLSLGENIHGKQCQRLA